MNDVTKQPGAFSWNELTTTDVDGAKVFYSELLGWTMEDMPAEGMTYTMLKVGKQEVAGMMATPPEAAGMPSMWGSYVTVDDVDVQAGKVEKLGGKVLVPPRDIPNVGRFCVIQDPQGATLSLISYA